MASRTNSVSEVFFSDDDFSPHFQNLYSPLSNLSNFSLNSQELNGITTPQRMFSHDEDEDYAHIQLPAHRQGTRIPPEPPVRTSSVSSVKSDYGQRSYPMVHEQDRNYNYSTYTLQHPHHQYYHHQQSRRKTWSPNGIKLSMTGGKYTGRPRNCSSSELLDNKPRQYGQIIYEDQEKGPPKLAPVSGMLAKSPAKGIIRPIAFKPVVVSANNFISHNNDNMSHDSHMIRQNGAQPSPQSVHMDSERSFGSSSGSTKHFSPSDRPDIFCMTSRVSTNHMDGYVGTPSPSDSGVGELEAMLREKDAEINTLREVMDKNERAIFQVYDEKKKTWLREIHDLKSDYEQKLKVLQRKAYKTEQVLSLQSYKAQQDLKSIQQELENVKAERDNLEKKSDWVEARYSDMMSMQGQNSSQDSELQQSFEVNDLQQKVEDLNSSIAKQNEDIQLLQFRLQEKECEILERENELSKTFKEVMTKTEEVKSLRKNLRRVSGDSDMELTDSSFCSCDKEIQTEKRNSVNSTPNTSGVRSPDSDSQSSISNLQQEMQELRDKLQTKTEMFEKEREQWKDEKNKVIRYQKQLQLNYLQMYNKNRMLEAEVEQLTLDLENRDLKLMAINGGEESMC